MAGVTRCDCALIEDTRAPRAVVATDAQHNRTLVNVLGVKLVGSLITFFTIIISLGDAPASSASNTGEGGVCTLSGVQIGTIQSLLADRNTSCSSYNVTLDAILGY